MRRTNDIEINIDNLSINQQLQPGKVMVIVLDGIQGKAKVCEAVEHGFTIIETVKGKAARVRFEESELF